MVTTARHVLALGLFFGCVVACSSDRRDDGVSPPAPTGSEPTNAPARSAAATRSADSRLANAPAIGAALNLSDLARRAHLAFRPDRDGRDRWRSAQETYEVRAAADGVSIAPGRSGELAAPLLLGASRIARGAKAPAGVAVLEPDGRLSIDRGVAREELANGDDGVEQSWRFASSPHGAGDLVVRIAASGEHYAGETALGLHFAADGSPFGIRYGTATWIDATGKRTELRPRFEDGEIVLRVPSDVVDRAAYPAVLDPVISAEFGMDTPIVTNAPLDQIQPAASYNGSNHLVVWNDARQVLRGTIIYGARVSPAGTVLDPTGIVLSTATVGGSQHEVTPALASDGTNWLLAFADSGNVFVAQVRSDGNPSGTTMISTGTNNSSPQIAYDGTNYLVVWLQGTSIVGVRVAPNGAPVDATPVSILANTCSTTPGVAFNGANYLVICTNGTGVFLSIVSPALAVGTTQNPYNAAIAGTLTPVVAASGAGLFFVAAQTTNDNTIQTGILDATGTPTIPSAKFFGVGSGTGISKMSAIYGGKQFLLAWGSQISATDSSIRAARITVGGVSLDGPAGAVVADQASFQWYPAASFDGANYLLAFQDARVTATSYDIYAGRFTTGLVPLEGPAGFLVSGAANTEILPSVGYSAPNYLVAWQDQRGGPAIYGERVTPAGATLDTPAITIATSGSPSAPGVFNAPGAAGDWGVLWQASGTTYGTGVNANGTLGMGGALSAGTQEVAQAGACDGTYCLVVWQDNRSSGTTGSHIYGMLVNGSGPVGGSETQITAATGEFAPSAAYVGGNYLVAYQVGGANKDIYATHVTVAGGVITPGAVVSVATTTDQEADPCVATDGTNFFVAWDQGAAIRGVPILATGGLQAAPLEIANAPVTARLRPRLAYDGGQYVVVWMDQRAGNWDIYSARVLGGSVVDPNGTAVSATSTDEILPAVASAGGRLSLVVYDSFASSGAFRVEGRTFDDKQAQGGACQSASDCIAPNCVDNYCCSAPCTAGCQACSNAKTGQPNGTCANVTDRTDPNASCAAPPLPSCETSACVTGACTTLIGATSCVISSACVASGAANPADACQTCQPAQSQTAWTTQANSCAIAGVCYADGAQNPANGCQKCVASASTTTWSSVSDGTACAADALACTADICGSGACTHPIASGSCVINGACLASGAPNPTNACQTCQPAQNQTAWTTQANSCSIGGVCYADGTLNPANACQMCVVSASTTSWTNTNAACADDGLGCTADLCLGGACTHPIGSGSCVIANTCVAANATNPANACQACNPAQSATAWTNIAGCGDAGSADAGSADAGTADAGSADAGTDGGVCVPRTCLDFGPATCGNLPDTCGALVLCGNCSAPATCGGGGVPNQCGQADGGSSDGGSSDGGTADGGANGDSGTADAAGSDGGEQDAGSFDAGPLDAGPIGTDAAASNEAGGAAEDAGGDAGAGPTGPAGSDAGAGAEVDAANDGAVGAAPVNQDSGCACRATSSQAPWDVRGFGVMLAGVLALARRRSARRNEERAARLG